MKLDSEEQRQTLINCIQSASLSGMFVELAQIVAQVSATLAAVQEAEIEKPEETVDATDLHGNAVKVPLSEF